MVSKLKLALFKKPEETKSLTVDILPIFTTTQVYAVLLPIGKPNELKLGRVSEVEVVKT